MARLQLLLISFALCACPRPAHVPSQLPRVQVKADATADQALASALELGKTVSRKQTIEALLAVRKAYPESTAGQEALYRAGVLSFEEGDYLVARRHLNELVYENPLHPKADEARLKAGLAAIELKAWREGAQTLSSLLERLSGEERRLAEEALQRAMAATQQYNQVLTAALKATEEAATPEDQASSLRALEVTLDTRTDARAIAEAWQGLSPQHVGWPLVTFKLVRIYFHVRDWPRLDETLALLIERAPDSPWAAQARALKTRLSRRAAVRPKAIGAVLPLSGKYKAFGETALRGLQLALKGSEVELVVKDSQGDAALTGTLVEQLALDEGVMAIVGPLLNDDARRAALVAEELEVPLLSMARTSNITDIGPHVFRTMVTSEEQAQALADYAIGTLGYKTFAILSPNTALGTEFTNAFWDAIEKRGGEIRGIESYDFDQKTFTEEAQKLVGRYYLEDRPDYVERLRDIRAKDIDEFRRRKAIERMRSKLDPLVDFEALFLPDFWQQVSLVAPALAVEDIITNACDKKDLERIQKTTGKEKLQTVTLLGPSTWSSPKGTSGEAMLIERGGKYVLCGVYVDTFFEGSERNGTKAFVAAFRAAHADASMTLLDVVGYDTGAIVRHLVERAQPATREAFRNHLAGLKNFQGASTTIDFDDDRSARRALFLLNITPNGIREVKAQGKPAG